MVQGRGTGLRQLPVECLELLPVESGVFRIELRNPGLNRFGHHLNVDLDASAPDVLRNKLAAIIFELDEILGQSECHIQTAAVQRPDLDDDRKPSILNLTATEGGHTLDQRQPPDSW